jgi:hypothetical protein
MHDIAVIDFENLLLKEDYDELELSKWREIGDKVYNATSEYGNLIFIYSIVLLIIFNRIFLY